MQSNPLPDTAFWQQYLAPAKGILRFTDLDRLMDILKDSQGEWFVFDPEGPPPVEPLVDEEFAAALGQVKTLVNSGRDRECSGAVYVDNPENPTFVKVFDPRNMGASCGYSGAPVFPRWIISRLKPDALPPAPEPAKAGLFARIRGKA